MTFLRPQKVHSKFFHQNDFIENGEFYASNLSEGRNLQRFQSCGKFANAIRTGKVVIHVILPEIDRHFRVSRRPEHIDIPTTFMGLKLN